MRPQAAAPPKSRKQATPIEIDQPYDAAIHAAAIGAMSPPIFPQVFMMAADWPLAACPHSAACVQKMPSLTPSQPGKSQQGDHPIRFLEADGHQPLAAAALAEHGHAPWI